MPKRKNKGQKSKGKQGKKGKGKEKEIHGRRFKKKGKKIVEIKEEDIILGKLRRQIDALESELNSMHALKKIPNNADKDIEEAIDYWNSERVMPSTKKDLKEELKKKRTLLEELEKL